MCSSLLCEISPNKANAPVLNKPIAKPIQQRSTKKKLKLELTANKKQLAEKIIKNAEVYTLAYTSLKKNLREKTKEIREKYA